MIGPKPGRSLLLWGSVLHWTPFDHGGDDLLASMESRESLNTCEARRLIEGSLGEGLHLA